MSFSQIAFPVVLSPVFPSRDDLLERIAVVGELVLHRHRDGVVQCADRELICLQIFQFFREQLCRDVLAVTLQPLEALHVEIESCDDLDLLLSTQDVQRVGDRQEDLLTPALIPPASKTLSLHASFPQIVGIMKYLDMPISRLCLEVAILMEVCVRIARRSVAVREGTVSGATNISGDPRRN